MNSHPSLIPFFLTALLSIAPNPSRSAPTTPPAIDVPKFVLPLLPSPEDEVSLDTARRIAVFEIESRFGKAAFRDAILGYDLGGSIRAYLFVARIGADVFPADDAILEDLGEARRELAAIRAAAGPRDRPDRRDAPAAVRRVARRVFGTDEYATVVVSARRDLAPVQTLGNGLPYLYTWRARAEEMAAQELGEPARLARFYFGGSLDQILEFESPSGGRVWVVLFPPRVATPGSILPRAIEVTADEQVWVRQAWDEELAAVQGLPTDLRADYWVGGRSDAVPAYLWSAGCSPTSATMVVSYYDWDSPAGRKKGWGKLVPYCFEHQEISQWPDRSGDLYQWDAQLMDPGGTIGIPGVPLARMAYGMNTEATTGGTPVGSGMTNIRDGILAWTNGYCGYAFTGIEYFSSSVFQPVWNYISNAVVDDHPSVWSRDGAWAPLGGNVANHSVATIGVSTTQLIYYHSTWDWNWWGDPYQGNGQTWADVATATPGGGAAGQDFELTAPDGSENWNAGSVRNITWYQWGTQITRYEMYYSTDRGRTWNYITQVSGGAGSHSYAWNVPILCTLNDHCFVRLDGFAGFTYLAGEGSAERFTILPPVNLSPPTLVSPPNGATDQPSAVMLDWDNAPNTLQYHVVLGTVCGAGTSRTTNVSQAWFEDLLPNTTYYWQVRSINACGSLGPPSACFQFTTAPPVGVQESTPIEGPFRIVSVSPQPARGPVVVQYVLPEPRLVVAAVYDVAGRLVRELDQAMQESGTRTVEWDGAGEDGRVPGSGIYFLRLRAANEERNVRIVLVR
ncbi:MAG: FlgD immunoglobulin-like domain containing protein [bacterium]